MAFFGVELSGSRTENVIGERWTNLVARESLPRVKRPDRRAAALPEPLELDAQHLFGLYSR